MRHRRRRLRRQLRRWGTTQGRRLYPRWVVYKGLHDLWEASKRGESTGLFGLDRDTKSTRLDIILY